MLVIWTLFCLTVQGYGKPIEVDPDHFAMQNEGPEIELLADEHGVKVNARPAGLYVGSDTRTFHHRHRHQPHYHHYHQDHQQQHRHHHRHHYYHHHDHYYHPVVEHHEHVTHTHHHYDPPVVEHRYGQGIDPSVWERIEGHDPVIQRHGHHHRHHHHHHRDHLYHPVIEHHGHVTHDIHHYDPPVIEHRFGQDIDSSVAGIHRDEILQRLPAVNHPPVKENVTAFVREMVVKGLSAGFSKPRLLRYHEDPLLSSVIPVETHSGEEEKSEHSSSDHNSLHADSVEPLPELLHYYNDPVGYDITGDFPEAGGLANRDSDMPEQYMNGG